METRVAYAAVGVFVIAMSAALIGLGLWLGADIQTREYQPYLFITSESASGISPGSVVKYRGVEVGRVRSLSLENAEQVRITLDIEKGTPIKIDTRASIATQGVTGLAYIELSGGSIDAPDLRPWPGNEPPLIPPAPSLLRRLDVAISKNLNNLEDISIQIRSLLSDDNIEALSRLTRNLASLSDTLAEERGRIAAILENTERMTKAGRAAFERLPATLDALDHTLRETRAAVANFSNTSISMKTRTDEVSAEIIAMRRNLEPSVQTLLDQLDRTAGGIEELTRALRQDPSQLFFGPPRASPGPGER